jgi:type II secretory pathway component PulF
MPRFIYKAKQGPDRIVEGELDAPSRAAALAAIDKMGCTAVSVEEKAGAGDGARGRAFIFGRVTSRDISVLTRQLASLTKSGVPILRSLATLVEQTENPKLRKIMAAIENSVRDGNMLSDAMSKFPEVFSGLYVNMVRAGESAGILDTILNRMADALEREEDMRRKVQSAIAYPALILAMGVVTVFVLLAFFLPRVVALFKDYKSLPIPTKMLIGLSDFVSGSWYWILIVAILLFAVFRRLTAMEAGRSFLDLLKLSLPLVGVAMQEADIARFARTLSLLIEAGIPLDRGLTLAANTMKNSVLGHEIEQLRNQTVVQGMQISVGLKKAKYFPPLVANMAGVGEEAGRLDESFAEIATFYEKDVDQRTRMATSLLEPILILAVGAIVGFIVAAMLLPIFKLSTAL